MDSFEYAAIFTYKCVECGEVIKVWNARGEGGPIVVTCRSCCGQSAVDMLQTIHRSSIAMLKEFKDFDLYVLVNCTESKARELVGYYFNELAAGVDSELLAYFENKKFDEIYCNGKAPLLITLQEYESGEYSQK